MRLPRWSFLAAILAAAPVNAQEIAALDLYVRPDKGNCIACHQLPQGTGPQTRADVGPRLEGERLRGLGRAALREILVDASQRNADTLMPPYGRHRILTAAEIDRLVEFLHALP
jgi:sulfur-oxidizing protein SoxX